MKNNTIKAAVMLSALSASPIASSSSTVYATDLMGFMGFLNVILHVAISLAPLFIAIALIHIIHYVYKGKPATTLASASESMPVATSINQRAFNKNQSRASKLAPPPMRVEEEAEDAVGDAVPTKNRSTSSSSKYDFLADYPDIKIAYSRVVDLHARIKNSDMSLMLKHRADGLKATADKTIDTLRSIHKVTSVTEKTISSASGKLSSAIKALSDVIESYQEAMDIEFDKIKIADTFEQQDELEHLRREGQALLNKIKNDSSFDISEDKFRLDKIVNERLDQVWRDYTAAKHKYYAPVPSETLLITDQRSSQDPDAALNNVFLEIKSIYSDIEMGVKTKQKEMTMTNLIANKNYFENR